MKTLIVEDDFTSRKMLQAFLAPFGECDIAVDGVEAVEAFRAAHGEGEPYDLVCLDLMMPRLDGHATLAAIRAFEEERGIHVTDGAKVVVTTCLGDSRNVLAAFQGQCDAYLVKPVDRRELASTLSRLSLIVDHSSRGAAVS